ncbi:MAG: AAA family ATPase, partial [Betaproteobacteria bacterium]|nr:AAA family ATPase [Betaproteobacteria bacterium]
MSKAKSAYICAGCGLQLPRWQGQCPQCREWNTLAETVIERGAQSRRAAGSGSAAKMQKLVALEAREEPRIPSSIDEFDRVLGGGLVPGGVVLIGGDPGIGKSTLLLQALCGLADEYPVVYVSGEESGEQVALRARRLQLSPGNLQLLTEINLERIIESLSEAAPRVAVIDSIQTIYSENLQSAPGSVGQVRECAAQLTRHAKQSGTTLILVG